jgi:hypothetical protein
MLENSQQKKKKKKKKMPTLKAANPQGNFMHNEAVQTCSIISTV